MTNRRDQPNDELRARLRRATRTGVSMPPAMDDAIHRAIRASAGIPAGRRRRRARSRWVAAAALAIAGIGTGLVLRGGGPSNRNVLLVGDIDGNQRLDIVDAMLLDRQRRAGTAPVRQTDLNGNGRLDRNDVDILGGWIVKLPEAVG